MSKYAKFLKDLCTNKKKLEEIANIPINAEVSAIEQNKIPPKIEDLGSFTISCVIGNLKVTNSLVDLGASIKLMTYSLFSKLGLGELTPTRMSIQLNERSVKISRGIVENMLVRVDKFIFSVDFAILDMDVDSKIAFILGRPFLATTRALIDVFGKTLTLRVEDEEVVFDLTKSMKYSSRQDDTLYYVDASYFDFDEDVIEDWDGEDMRELKEIDKQEIW